MRVGTALLPPPEDEITWSGFAGLQAAALLGGAAWAGAVYRPLHRPFPL